MSMGFYMLRHAEGWEPPPQKANPWRPGSQPRARHPCYDRQDPTGGVYIGACKIIGISVEEGEHKDIEGESAGPKRTRSLL